MTPPLTTKVIEMNPKHADAWNGRALSFYALNNFAFALSDFSKVIELAPKFATAYHNRGVCYQKLGDETKAQADFATAKGFGYND